MKTKFIAFLELMRPANVITAFADIVAGMSIVGFVFGIGSDQLITLATLGFSSMCLYAGGVVFNDVFDSTLDAKERPERALPSGRIKKMHAIIGGLILLATGIFLGFWHSKLSGIIAIMVTICALFYDWKGKHMSIFGPLNMGICRAFNLLLGMSVIETGLFAQYYLVLIPLIYITAITMVSRGEVHGSRPALLYQSGILFLIVHVVQVLVAIQKNHLLFALPFIFVHAYLILSKLWMAIQEPSGPNIGKTVKMGVLTLILMNAAWVSLSGQWETAILVLLLLPISVRLGKKFAVT